MVRIFNHAVLDLVFCLAFLLFMFQNAIAKDAQCCLRFILLLFCQNEAFFFFCRKTARSHFALIHCGN